MIEVLLLGAGTIGRMIATLLVQSGDFRVRVGDTDVGQQNACAKLGISRC